MATAPSSLIIFFFQAWVLKLSRERRQGWLRRAHTHARAPASSTCGPGNPQPAREHAGVRPRSQGVPRSRPKRASPPAYEQEGPRNPRAQSARPQIPQAARTGTPPGRGVLVLTRGGLREPLLGEGRPLPRQHGVVGRHEPGSCVGRSPWSTCSRSPRESGRPRAPHGRDTHQPALSGS